MSRVSIVSYRLIAVLCLGALLGAPAVAQQVNSGTLFFNELPPDFTGYRRVEVKWTDFDLPATCSYPFFTLTVHLNGNTLQGQCVDLAELNPDIAGNVAVFNVSHSSIYLEMINLEFLNLAEEVSLCTIHFAGLPGSTVEVSFGSPNGFYNSCTGIESPVLDSPLDVFFPALDVSGAIYKAPFTQSNCGNGVDAGIPAVEVYLSTGPSCPPAHAEQSTLTDAMGSYGFSVHSLFDYGLFPYKDNNPDCGVNALDYYLLYYHLLGLNLLDYPYQAVAADMDLNRTLTIGDVVNIIRLINGTFDPPDRWRSWTFMPAWTYAGFPPVNSQYYSYPEYDEYIPLYNLAGDALNQDFTGIKRGDVDGSCSDCGAEWGPGESADRTEAVALQLHIPVMNAGAGERLGVPVYLSGLDEPVVALAAALEVASELFDIEGVEPGLLGFSEPTMVNAEAFAEGLVRIAWLDMDRAQPVAGSGEPLFYLWVRSKAKGASTVNAIRLRVDVQDCSVVTASGQRFELSSVRTARPQQIRVYAAPNPVSSGEEVRFYTEGALSGPMWLELVDGRGSVVWQGYWPQMDEGMPLQIPTAGLPSGWLAWRLRSGQGTYSGRLLILD